MGTPTTLNAWLRAAADGRRRASWGIPHCRRVAAECLVVAIQQA